MCVASDALEGFSAPFYIAYGTIERKNYKLSDLIHGRMKGCRLIKPVNGQNKFLRNGERMDCGEIFIL